MKEEKTAGPVHSINKLRQLAVVGIPFSLWPLSPSLLLLLLLLSGVGAGMLVSTRHSLPV